MDLYALICGVFSRCCCAYPYGRSCYTYFCSLFICEQTLCLIDLCMQTVEKATTTTGTTGAAAPPAAVAWKPKQNVASMGSYGLPT